MSRLDDVKDAFLASTQGLTVEEKLWAINSAFPDVVHDLIDVRVAKEFEKRNNDSNAIVDNTREKYSIKCGDNTVEIITGYSINVDIDSSVECGYVGGGGMHFTYDNPEETTIRLMF